MAEKELKSIKFPGLEDVYKVPSGGSGSGGADGYSPVAKVEETADGAKITITDKTGTTEATVKNGADGAPGADGYSPEATVAQINGGVKIIIKDKNGTTSENVMNGSNGLPGHTPEITAEKSGKVTTIKADGTAIAEISDGSDGDPGKDGAGMDITGAAAGQIAKISAVDENGVPTAWEPVDMPSGGGGGEKTFELLKEITTEEDVAFLNLDLGKEYSEVCISIYGRWTTGTTGAYVVINMCSNDSYSETDQTNAVFESARFYSNNDRMIIANLSTLSPGYWRAINADAVVANTARAKVTTADAYCGLNYIGSLPHRCRYLHIGTHSSQHQYKAGLVIKIWGK